MDEAAAPESKLLDHADLRRMLMEVFCYFYPPDVADALAVMHGQFHLRFAQAMEQVPVAPGEPPKLIRGQSKLVRAIRSVRGDRPGPVSPIRVRPLRMHEKDYDNVAVSLEDEIVGYFQSREGDQVRFDELLDYLHTFGCGIGVTRAALNQLIEQGQIQKVGKNKATTRYVYASKAGVKQSDSEA